MKHDVSFEQFLELFASISPTLQALDLDGQTRFRELAAWDSLTYLRFMITVEDNFGITLQQQDVRECPTLQKLYETVVQRSASGR